MTLRLFEQPSGREPRRVTLVRLAGEIARKATEIGLVAVEGEVHRPTTSKGGWVFFVLRDRAAQLSVVVPRAAVARSRTVAGERVCVVGALAFSPDRGQLQLEAEEVTPVGEGAIAALIEETRARLVAEGLIGRPRRRLPVLPEVVGVVCGADAAVRRDIESVVSERFPGYPLRFIETTVSGPGAQAAIVEAIHRAELEPEIDVLVLARGGGDAPSLLPWSSEEVCRAVAACRIPVVSAIGHDSDRPLCDEVADLRCATPSVAAAAVVPERKALCSHLSEQVQKAYALAAERLEMARRQLEVLDPGAALRSGVERAAVRLTFAGQRLADAHLGRRLVACRERLQAADWRRPAGEVIGRAEGLLQAERRHLAALSPARTLERGYAVVTGPSGSVLRRAREVLPGDRIRVRLSEGELQACVKEVLGG